MRLDLDVKYVRDQITALLLANPELADDDVLREDMIEAETNLDDLLAKLIRLVADTEDLQAGIKSRLEVLEIRWVRLDNRIESFRSLILKLLLAADIRKRVLPEATLSIRAGTTKVIITDEALIPDRLCKFIRKPNLPKIKEAIAYEGDCAGATLSNGGETLTIRVK